MVEAGGLAYLAGWPDDAGWDVILSRTCAAAGVAVRQLPEGLRMRAADGRTYLFNYGAETAMWEGLEIPPAGVAWVPR